MVHVVTLGECRSAETSSRYQVVEFGSTAELLSGTSIGLGGGVGPGTNAASFGAQQLQLVLVFCKQSLESQVLADDRQDLTKQVPLPQTLQPEQTVEAARWRLGARVNLIYNQESENCGQVKHKENLKRNTFFCCNWISCCIKTYGSCNGNRSPAG